MSGETNRLSPANKKISRNFSSSEYDSVLATGEQVACSLIAGSLIDKGYKASILAWVAIANID